MFSPVTAGQTQIISRFFMLNGGGEKNSLIRNKSSEQTRDPDCGILLLFKVFFAQKIVKMFDNSEVGGREYVGKLFSDFQSTSAWIPLPSPPCQSILKRVKELGLLMFIAWSYMSFREWAGSWGLFCLFVSKPSLYWPGNLTFTNCSPAGLPLSLHLCVCACRKLRSTCRTVSGGDP